MSLRTKFGKKPVADASRERAFLWPQRKIRCATISFSGSAEVAAGLSNTGEMDMGAGSDVDPADGEAFTAHNPFDVDWGMLGPDEA